MREDAAILEDYSEAWVLCVRPGRVDEATAIARPRLVHHKHGRDPEGAKAHANDAKRLLTVYDVKPAAAPSDVGLGASRAVPGSGCAAAPWLGPSGRASHGPVPST